MNSTITCAKSVLLAAVALFSVSAADALTIGLNIPTLTPSEGEIVNIEVVVEDVFDGLDQFDEMLAFGFDVSTSDMSLLSFVGSSVFSPFDNDSALFENTDVAGSVFPGIRNDGINENVVLAMLTFEALGVGIASIAIDSDTSEFTEGLVYFVAGNMDINASVNVNIVPSPVSESSNTLIFMSISVFSVLTCTRFKHNSLLIRNNHMINGDTR